MRLFAPNPVTAKSRYWYFMHRLHKMKKGTGEILAVNEVCVFGRVSDVGRFTRQTRRWRTMESGCVTTLVLVLTTCTRSTVTRLFWELWSSAIRRWLELTVLAIVRFRSSRPLWWPMRTWRDIRTSCTLTRTWSTLCLIASTVLSPRSTDLPSSPPSLALAVDKGASRLCGMWILFVEQNSESCEWIKSRGIWDLEMILF